MLYFFNAILVLLELRKWAPVSDRVFERREKYTVLECRALIEKYYNYLRHHTSRDTVL